MEYNILDFGAVGGDGVADTTAFIDAMQAMNNGDVLRIPAKKFKILQTIHVNKSVALVGDNVKFSCLEACFLNGDMLSIDTWGVRLENLRFEDGVGKTSGALVNFTQHSNQSVLSNFETYGGFDGIKIYTGAKLHVEKGYMWGFSNVGIDVLDGGDQYITGVTMDNPENAQPQAGIRISATGCINVTDCDIIHSGKNMHIRGGASIFVINSYFDTAHEGVWIDASVGHVVRSHFIGCWMTSNTGGGVTVNSGSNLVDDVIFSDCIMDYNSNNGVYLAKGNSVKLTGSTMAGNAMSGLVLGDVKDSIITGNRIGGTTSIINGNAYGVWVVNPNNCIFTNNNTNGNGWAEGIVGAFNSTNIVKDNL